MSAHANTLIDILQPQRLTAVVDIGANPIDGAPPYAPLLQTGLCTLVGFEPQKTALAQLNQKKSAQETYLPYIIGDGAQATLHICSYSGWTSLLKPNAKSLKVFVDFGNSPKIIAEEKIKSRTLDSVAEIKHMDYLKIDVQGSELNIFKHGTQKLANAVFIQTEASFIPLYDNQPTFGEVDVFLRSQGFIPHSFAAIKKCMIAPMRNQAKPGEAINQLLEGDIVYVRDFVHHADAISDEQLKHMAIVAHYAYQSYDLATRCIYLLMQRKALDRKSMDKYLLSL